MMRMPTLFTDARRQPSSLAICTVASPEGCAVCYGAALTPRGQHVVRSLQGSPDWTNAERRGTAGVLGGIDGLIQALELLRVTPWKCQAQRSCGVWLMLGADEHLGLHIEAEGGP